MDDPFYDPDSHGAASKGLWKTILSAPPGLLATIAFAPLLLLLLTRILSERTRDEDIGDEELPPGLQSYWFPRVSRGILMLRSTHSGSRNRGRELFTLGLGFSMDRKESKSNSVEYGNALKTTPKINSATWNAASKFFGLSAKPRYAKVLEQLLQIQQKHFSGPHLLPLTIQNLERNIPQMISFIDSPIDLQPWEKIAAPFFISPTIMEINLFSVLQHMLGHASIPAIFGQGLLEKYPFLLQDLQVMDEGMEFFLLGLPAVVPWSGVFTAHMARRRVWEAMDEQQKVLDGLAREEEEEEEGGDLGDVSDFVLERNKLWRDNCFTVKERGDICLLYALIAAPTHQIYNLTLAIISTPSLLIRILAEIKPHVQLTEGMTIGKHSSLPSLAISTNGLTKKCPLLRSAYLETLRLSGNKGVVEERFKADRFMDPESKDREESAGFLENECLALVAGVLMMWECEPVEGEIWGEFGRGEMVRGGEGKRVRVKRRKIEWHF